MSNSLNDDCYQPANGHCFCIEFRVDKRRRGFHSSHLIEYTLEENPEAKDDPNTPPEQLVLAFATADVIVSGWRLGRLASLLHENKLAIVGIQPKRPNESDTNKPCVTSITITPIAKP
jgi:hypothetical protein